jgi:hypothetical protein
VALDTATTMVIDMAECYDDLPLELLNSTPPSHIYAVRAAIQHMYTRTNIKPIPWSRNSENRLESYLDQFNQRWGVASNKHTSSKGTGMERYMYN